MKAKVAHSLQTTNVLANVTHCGHVAAGAVTCLYQSHSPQLLLRVTNNLNFFCLFSTIFYYIQTDINLLTFLTTD